MLRIEILLNEMIIERSLINERNDYWTKWLLNEMIIEQLLNEMIIERYYWSKFPFIAMVFIHWIISLKDISVFLNFSFIVCFDNFTHSLLIKIHNHRLTFLFFCFNNGSSFNSLCFEWIQQYVFVNYL